MQLPEREHHGKFHAYQIDLPEGAVSVRYHWHGDAREERVTDPELEQGRLEKRIFAVEREDFAYRVFDAADNLIKSAVTTRPYEPIILGTYRLVDTTKSDTRWSELAQLLKELFGEAVQLHYKPAGAAGPLDPLDVIGSIGIKMIEQPECSVPSKGVVRL